MSRKLIVHVYLISFSCTMLRQISQVVMQASVFTISVKPSIALCIADKKIYIPRFPMYHKSSRGLVKLPMKIKMLTYLHNNHF